MMVVLIDPFRGLGAWRNSTESHSIHPVTSSSHFS